MKKRILHITNDYLGSKVYRELFGSLDVFFQQIVFCPIRDSTKEKLDNFSYRDIPYDVVFSSPLQKYHKLFFKKKIKFLFNELTREVKVNSLDIVHAHTWFSDGGVAYEMYKKYGISYVITVRSTDLDIFFKYFVHLRRYGLEILNNAEKIIFVTPVLFKKLFSAVDGQSSLKNKSVIIPNGVDQFWINNVNHTQKAEVSVPVQLVYIGTFIKRKKLPNIIKAVEVLNNKFNKFHLVIVGGGGGFESEIMKLINKNRDHITYHGKIKQKNEIMNILRSSDIFVMPSKNETFGLVYIEALSQGLPVIYSKNDGIYGLHDKNIGEAINGDNIDEIINAISQISNNYKDYKFDPSEIIKIHNWSYIAYQISSIYQEV